MLYLIRLKDTFIPKVVSADCAEVIKELYPNWKMYHYRETDHPVSVHPDEEWRITREVLPNIRFNKYCYWK